MGIPEIVELASNMKDEDIIYTYHIEGRLPYRIALEGANSDEILVSIQGSGGGYEKSLRINEISPILARFEEALSKCEEYGFKPDWDD